MRRAGRSRATAQRLGGIEAIRARQRAARRALRALEGRCADIGNLCPPEVPSASLRGMADELRALPADPCDPARFALAQEQLARYCEWMAEEARPHERSPSEVLMDLAEAVDQLGRQGAVKMPRRVAGKAIATQLVGLACALQQPEGAR
jgi:hypothetical protein